MRRFKTKRVFLTALLIVGVFISLPGCGGVVGGGQWNDPVKVSSTIPANAATEVVVGNVLTATFSGEMDPTSITTATFTLFQGATAITGTVSYSGVTAVFTPAIDLAANTIYTATITTGAKDRAGHALARDHAWSFTTGPDSTLPTVTATNNANGATGVPINTKISVTFNKTMNSATVTTTTFILSDGETEITGTVDYAGVTAIFTPASNLTTNTSYTATIRNGVNGAKDLAGNELVGNQVAPLPDYVWQFTTGVALDTTMPRVIATINADGATGVPVNTKVGATFSEAMDPLTITPASPPATFTLKQGATTVPGTVTYSGVNLVFIPDNHLAAGTTYTATITAAAKDLSGNALAGNQAPLPASSDYVWSWTTGAAQDTTNPTVTLTAPLNSATDVALNSAIHATFSKAMNPLSISTATFTVAGLSGVSGVVTYDATSRIATFTPSSNLLPSTTYTATITTGAKDLAGNAIIQGLVPNPWTFTTGTELSTGAVPLGLAATFGTFGGTAGMTNTGTLSLINGDIGTIATDTATITGFHDTAGDIYTETPANIGPVNGKIYSCTNSTTGPTSASPNAAACAIATQARLDAQTAYLALAAMPAGANPGANLANLTLAPGVYTSPSGSFLIEGGNLTLDAQGDANAVWVFQMAATLTVGGPGAAAPQSIILAGGAQAKNVFWQVGSFATINAAGGGTMVGTIISQAGVSFSTVGNVNIVTLNGRALSLGASVTLVDTVINLP